MKKVLIIGAGVEQVAAIKKAKDLGLFVITTDLSTEAPGIPFADQFHQVSTTDFEGNLKIAQQYSIDGAFTVCSETAVPVVARVCDSLNLNSFSIETSEFATNKASMRAQLSKHNITMAPYAIASLQSDVDRFVKSNKGPWVLKPVDSSGQRGTSVVYTENELTEKFNLALDASPAKQVLIDQEISGQEIHVTMLVIQKKVHFLAFSDRITLTGKNFGIAVNHIGPADLEKHTIDTLKNMCKATVEAINLQSGVCTCEIIVNDAGAFLLEVAVRVPGGYLKELAQLLSGIDINEATILNSIGGLKKIDDLSSIEKHKAVSVKFITALNFSESAIELQSLHFAPQYQKPENLIVFNLHNKLPFKINSLKSSVGRFGALIGVGDTTKEAVLVTEEAFKALRYNENHRLINYTSYTFRPNALKD